MNSLGFYSLITLMPIPSAPSSSSLFQTKSRRHEEKRSLIHGREPSAHTFHVCAVQCQRRRHAVCRKHLCSDFLGINYIMAVDGISAPLMLLTSLIIFAGSCISYDMNTPDQRVLCFPDDPGLRGVWRTCFANLLFYPSSSNSPSFQCTPSLVSGVPFVKITPP